MELTPTLYLAVLAVRNMPTEGLDLSPAQRLLRRCTKTQLPTTTELLKGKQLHMEDVEKQVKMPAQPSILPQQESKRPTPTAGTRRCHAHDMRLFTLNKKT